jgi:NodT family efflux transporter outer membrane factor (OMF) lipoprotein
MKHPILTSLFLLILSSCAVGPNYHTPPTPTPTQFKEAPAHLQSTAAHTQWWHTFEDPILNGLIERACCCNFDVQATIQKIMEKRYLYQFENAQLFPEIDLNGSWSRDRISQNIFSASSQGGVIQNFFEIGFDASWEIDVFGKQRRLKEQAFYLMQAEQENLGNVLISLMSEIARSYITLRTLQQQKILAEDSIKIQKKIVKLTKDLFQAGLDSENALLFAEETLKNLEATLPKIDTALKKNYYLLLRLMGDLPEQDCISLMKTEAVPTAHFDLKTDLPSTLIQRRPDIRDAERTLAAATASIGVSIADLFPQFSLLGSLSFETNNQNNWFNTASRTWSISPGIHWPILTFGRICSQIKAKTAHQQQVLFEYKQTILKAFEEVETSLVAYFKQKATLQIRQEELHLINMRKQLIEDRYQSGLVSEIDYLEITKDWLDTKNTVLNAQQEEASFLISVYKALGGGW